MTHKTKMKNFQGTTLIEMVVALSTGVILTTVLGFSLQGWMNSCRMEGEVKEMYIDLIKSRAKAIQQNRAHFIVIKANDYQIYEDTNDNGEYDVDIDKNVVFANPKTQVRSSLWTGIVSMDNRGLVRTKPGQNGTIRFDVGSNNPDHDCIVLWATRINMGKWNGTNCIAR